MDRGAVFLPWLDFHRLFEDLLPCKRDWPWACFFLVSLVTSSRASLLSSQGEGQPLGAGILFVSLYSWGALHVNPSVAGTESPSLWVGWPMSQAPSQESSGAGSAGSHCLNSIFSLHHLPVGPALSVHLCAWEMAWPFRERGALGPRDWNFGWLLKNI